MASNDSDLDKLTLLMGQCLGRIDEEAFRLQEKGEDVDFDTANRLNDETGMLHELVESMLDVEMNSSETNVNQIVARVAESYLQELAVPIVLRQTLTAESPIIVFDGDELVERTRLDEILNRPFRRPKLRERD